MNKYHLWGIAVGFLFLVIFFWRDNARPNSPVQAAEPLEGTLYRAEIPELTKADPPLPELPPKPDMTPRIAVSRLNLVNLGIVVSTGPYLINIEDDATAPFRLVRNGVPKINRQGTAATVKASTPTWSAATAPGFVPNTYNFKTLDRLIETSDTTGLLHGHYQKGDIALEFGKLLRWHNRYLLKFTITNDGDREFFISGARVLADSHAILAQEFLPFSCRSHETEACIMTFAVSDVISKQVTLQVLESGRKDPVLEIKHVDYPF